MTNPHTCADCSGKFILPGQRICEPCKAEAKGEKFDPARAMGDVK